jgi:hypothetical protein
MRKVRSSASLSTWIVRASSETRELIERCGYGRRDEELNLEAVLAAASRGFRRGS